MEREDRFKFGPTVLCAELHFVDVQSWNTETLGPQRPFLIAASLSLSTYLTSSFSLMLKTFPARCGVVVCAWNPSTPNQTQ